MNTFSNDTADTAFDAPNEKFDPHDGSRLTPHFARDSEMARLHQEGWTLRALGERYGLRHGGVYSALWRVACRRARPALFDLGARASNALWLEFHPETPTVEAIARVSYAGLLEIPNVGSGTALEISAMLWRRGIAIDGLPEKLRVAFEAEYGRIDSDK